MNKLARYQDKIVYYRLERPYELDKLEFDEFTYFRKYLGMTDYVGNFKSWLRRQNVLLIIAVSQGKVSGWVMNERWNQPSSDGMPVTVLRAVEVSPRITRGGIGRTLFNLSSQVLMGHIITKPVNEAAKKFFTSLNFTFPDKNSPINLSNHPGYLVLPDELKNKNVISTGVTVFEDAIFKSKNLLFASEMLEIAKKAALDKSLAGRNKTHIPDVTPATPVQENARYRSHLLGVHNATLYVQQENQVIPDTQQKKQPATAFTPATPDTHVQKGARGRSYLPEVHQVIPNIQQETKMEGTFMGIQKMLSPCNCGEFKAKKYELSGEREGVAVICAACGRERYFFKWIRYRHL